MRVIGRRTFLKCAAATALAPVAACGQASAQSGGGYEITLNSNLATVGNSLIDQSVDMVHYFAARVGRGRGALSHQTIPGAPMNWNWNHAETAFVNNRAVLEQGRQDVFMGVESVPFRHVQGPGDACDINAWRKWYNLAVTNGVTRFFLFEAWHDLQSGLPSYVPEDGADPDTGIPWRERIDFARPYWKGIVDHVNAGRRAGQPEMNMIPGGAMMGRIHDDIAAGRAPATLGRINDLFLDTIHPTIPGRYAMACIMYACIYRRSPVGLPGSTTDIWGRPYAGVRRDEARYFQEVAWDVARADPLTGLSA